MPRVLKNRRVSLTGSAAPVNREEVAPTAIAVESENARLGTIGAWRQDNVAISQSGVALPFQSVDAASQVDYVAPRSGKIVGMTYRTSAAFTAGIGTIRATIGGTAVGDTESLVNVGTSGVLDQSAEIAFAEGALLGVKITSDANLLPAGSVELGVSLIVRWDP